MIGQVEEMLHSLGGEASIPISSAPSHPHISPDPTPAVGVPTPTSNATALAAVDGDESDEETLDNVQLDTGVMPSLEDMASVVEYVCMLVLWMIVNNVIVIDLWCCAILLPPTHCSPHIAPTGAPSR